MRISDWSSDVCSSDLDEGDEDRAEKGQRHPGGNPIGAHNRPEHTASRQRMEELVQPPQRATAVSSLSRASTQCSPSGVRSSFQNGALVFRSEEHTSELQSLMRISYAVFCLKKTKHIQNERQD